MDSTQSFPRHNLLLTGQDKLRPDIDNQPNPSPSSTHPKLFFTDHPVSDMQIDIPHQPQYRDARTGLDVGMDPGWVGDPRPHRGVNAPSEATLALVLPLLILLSTLLFLLLMFLLFLIVVRRRRGIVLRDEDGPLDVGREEEYEAEGGMEGVETTWLEGVEVATRKGYARAKDWQISYPPNSQPSDITLSQFLTIQEKGVSAWSFEPDYELNPPVFVQSRTEITFLADGAGMAPEEGGGCAVHSNLPLPRLNEVYYWEVKLFEKPDETTVAIGLTTKPYPPFRLPGWNKYSIGYFSSDGNKCHNHPFSAVPYGPPLMQGDVLGIGYRPRTGTVFFTRNGKKLEDAYIGLDRYNLFPTVGANGAATLHVNLGQAGFVFIEANVKKWGLAPTMGTLAPPPAYGAEADSIRLQAAADVAARSGQGEDPAGGSSTPRDRGQRQRRRRPRVGADGNPINPTNQASTSSRPDPSRRGGSTSSYHDHVPVAGPSTPVASSSTPRPMPTPSRNSRPGDSTFSHSRPPQSVSSDDESLPHNPPTPNILDISLHSLRPFADREADAAAARDRALVTAAEARRSDDESGDESTGSGSGGGRCSGGGSPTMDLVRERERRAAEMSPGLQQRLLWESRAPPENASVRPPEYSDVDPNKYPAGVWEAMLEEQFQSAAAASSSQHGYPGHHSAHGHPSHTHATHHSHFPHLPQAGPSGSASGSLRSYEGRQTTGGPSRSAFGRQPQIASPLSPGAQPGPGPAGSGVGTGAAGAASGGGWRSWFGAGRRADDEEV